MQNNNQNTSVVSELNIPPEVQEHFPEIIAMTQKSESMNREERQYWIDVLLIMTEGQINNLKDILENEVKEIKKADDEYKDNMENAVHKAKIRFDEFKYKEKKRIILEAETAHELSEKGHEEELLKELETIK